MDEEVMYYIQKLCHPQGLFITTPNAVAEVHDLVVSAGKKAAISALKQLNGKHIKSIQHLVKEMKREVKQELTSSSSSKKTQSPITAYFKPTTPDSNGDSSGGPHSKRRKASLYLDSGRPTNRQLDFSSEDVVNEPASPPKIIVNNPASPPKIVVNDRASPPEISEQLRVLSVLEFRKLFLILSYLGRRKLEDVISKDSAEKIAQMTDFTMRDFESEIWYMFGRTNNKSDRVQYSDWDSGKTHVYNCHVTKDGVLYFKGPHLITTKTHLQRDLGDENVLIVKFEEVEGYVSKNIAAEGILVGLWRYRFFVFKDESNEVKKKNQPEEKKKPAIVKCCFVRLDSFFPGEERLAYALYGKTIYEARCHFMHVHMVSSMAKYMARFSLILSKTVKLPIDLETVNVEIIDDIPCKDEMYNVILGEEGKPLIHTDGTGFISEDLAAKCPTDFSRASYIKDDCLQNVRDVLEGLSGEDRNGEPPLLMQCRLFKDGYAVKGTLLVNKKLDPRTIQIRPSMIKVEGDPNCPIKAVSSLEVVAISRKPRKAYLSKNLIALLSYGGVPEEFFQGLLMTALEETKSVFKKKRAAFRVAMNHGESDDSFTSARMMAVGIPLDEPYLQFRLCQLANEEKKKFRGGKIPISESYYLIGTSDPTDTLNSDEVCVIHERGQISGKVLVYRNPCLHFGDIHVMTAKPVEAIQDVVGNAKYGIFFSTKGRKSAAAEMGNGDFDGDVYWVSQHPELLEKFNQSMPWTRTLPTPPPDLIKAKKPRDFTPHGLEIELFRQLQDAGNPSISMGVAAESWLAHMDYFLMLGDSDDEQKKHLRQKILKLIDIYYDALDAPKSGKKVSVLSHSLIVCDFISHKVDILLPNSVTIDPFLKAKKFPHHMEKEGSFKTYVSGSILGHIYDLPELLEPEQPQIQDLLKIPCFDIELSETSLNKWTELYEKYREEMSNAMSNAMKIPDLEARKRIPDEITKKYRKMLYEAEDFDDSPRNSEDIFSEALAIYNIVYDYAKSQCDLKKCGFAWKVAGSALCKFHSSKQNEKPMLILPSLLREFI